MRDIFADLYNKVLSFFVTPEGDQTKSVAKSRLKTVLMQDRVGFSERAMQMLKEELVATISKYMEIDEDAVDLEINAEEENTVLNLAIPVSRVKTDEEIDKAIKEQAVKTQAKAQEIVEELEELIKERAAVLAGVKEEDTNSDSNEAQEKDEQEEDTASTEEKEEETQQAQPKEPEEKKEACTKENSGKKTRS